MSALLDAALEYAAAGLPVYLPLAARRQLQLPPR